MTDDPRTILDAVVRRARGQLVAGLVARFGTHNLALAEDAAHDALIEALSRWSFSGRPDNAEAWLARVARNKMIDRLRRAGREISHADESEGSYPVMNLGDLPSADVETRVLSADVADPELRLMVLCGDPRLTRQEQLTLTLKMASGFTARDIATVLLADESAIGQRLARAMRKLKEAGPQAVSSAAHEPLTVFDLKARAPVVMATIHLLFCLGYAPRTGARLLRRDLCFEALRLARLLGEHAATRGPDADALTALIAFQASRLVAREAKSDEGANAASRPVLLKDQDRTLWDSSLIRFGMSRLARAKAGTEAGMGEGARPSLYHLEAAIAAIHASAPNWEATDWGGIETMYDAMMQAGAGPVAAVNRAIVIAQRGRAQEALGLLDEIGADPALRRYGPFHLARGELLLKLNRPAEARLAFADALAAGFSRPVEEFVAGRAGAENSLF